MCLSSGLPVLLLLLPASVNNQKSSGYANSPAGPVPPTDSCSRQACTPQVKSLFALIPFVLFVSPNPHVCLRLYVPEFASTLSVSVGDCSSGDEADGGNCPLFLRIGSVSLRHGPVTVNCSGTTCSAALSNPPWDTWLRVDVESGHDNRSITFTIVSNSTGDHTKERQRHTHTHNCF